MDAGLHEFSLRPLVQGLEPITRWAGGKRWQRDIVADLVASLPSSRLVEPFCGGLSVSLGLKPAVALLNDKNAALINFYRHVRDGFVIDLEMRRDRALYNRHRARFNELVCSGVVEGEELAGLFYYLASCNFNGLWRVNRRGTFNVPFGGSGGPELKRSFEVYAESFREWTFVSVDFEEVPIRTGDIIYADPPYDGGYVQYTRDGFSWRDQERVARHFAQHDGPVILVNKATDRVVDLYRRSGFDLRYLDAPRMISADGNRTSVTEVMATRNLGAHRISSPV